MWKWERQSVIWIGSVCVQCKRSHSRWIAFAHTPAFYRMLYAKGDGLKCGWQLTLYCFSFFIVYFSRYTSTRIHAYNDTGTYKHIHRPSCTCTVLKRKLQTSNTLPKMGLYNIYIDIKCATNEHRTHDPKCSVSFLFHELRYIYYWA